MTSSSASGSPGVSETSVTALGDGSASRAILARSAIVAINGPAPISPAMIDASPRTALTSARGVRTASMASACRYPHQASSYGRCGASNRPAAAFQRQGRATHEARRLGLRQRQIASRLVEHGAPVVRMPTRSSLSCSSLASPRARPPSPRLVTSRAAMVAISASTVTPSRSTLARNRTSSASASQSSPSSTLLRASSSRPSTSASSIRPSARLPRTRYR